MSNCNPLFTSISQSCHINLGNDNPGILGLFSYDPETAVIYCQLAEHLLRGKHKLPVEFRELVAAYVSKINSCNFCYNSHKAIALASTENSQQLIEEVLCDNFSNLSPKYYYLLQIAGYLAHNVQGVSQAMIQTAKEFEATDAEIHRTIQIAAAFCMYNRYVDGLATVPGTPEYYKEAGRSISENGYIARAVMQD